MSEGNVPQYRAVFTGKGKKTRKNPHKLVLGGMRFLRDRSIVLTDEFVAESHLDDKDIYLEVLQHMKENYGLKIRPYGGFAYEPTIKKPKKSKAIVSPVIW